MALERFIPKSPDANIRNTQDFEVAKFGHLNTIVEYINNNSAKPAGLNGYVQFNNNNALGADADLFWDNTNKYLGIGNTTPAYQLSLSKQLYTQKGAYLAIDGSTTSGVGNYVGIGTTSPTALLHLVYTYGQVVRNQRIGDSLNGAPTYENLKSGGVPNALTAVLANTNLGQYTWRGSTGATTQGLGARLQVWSLENFTTSSYGSRLDISVTQLGTTTEVIMMNLRGTGVNIGNGTNDLGARLGIKGSGSTSATTALLVQNSAGTTLLQTLDDATTTLAGKTFTGTGTILVPSQAHSASDIVMKGDSALISANGNANQWGKIVLCDVGASTTYQNYGQGHLFKIGTGSGTTYLSIFANSITTGASTRITMGAQDASDIYQGTGVNFYGSFLPFGGTGNTVFKNSYTAGSYQFFTAPSVDGTLVEALRITNTGRLGIGTSSPTKKLDVVGSAADGIIRVAGPYSEIQLINKNSPYNTGDWKPSIYFLENGVFQSSIEYAGGYFEFGAGITTGSSITASSATLNSGSLNLNGGGQTITFTDTVFGLIRGSIELTNTGAPYTYNMNVGTNNGAINFRTGGANTRLSIAQAGGVTITGGGSTSGTTSLLVQNSSGTELLRVRDDGAIIQSTGSTTLYNGLTVLFAGINATAGLIQTTGAITATGDGNRIGKLQILTTGNAGITGFGITVGSQIDFQGYNDDYINGGTGTAIASQFLFRRYDNNQFNLNSPAIDHGILTIANTGFSSGNSSNLRGNTLWIKPTYSLTNAGLTGTIVRGIYYDPTLTSLTNTTHYGIQTTSGGAYINTTTPQASAVLQADSTTQGLLPPRMTTAQRTAISSPAAGLVVFDTTLQNLCYYRDGVWVQATFTAA